MDLLASPEDDPITPLEAAPYVCHVEWDGLAFFEYAHRRGLLHAIPSNLSRFTNTSAEAGDRVWQFTELLYPTPKADWQAFLQTWLFFGLLCEFLGLNESADGGRLVDGPSAREERDRLYQQLVVDGAGGTKWLSGASLVDPAYSLATRIVQRIKLAGDGAGLPQRIAHLHRCLTFARFMLSDAANNRGSSPDAAAGADRAVRYSMAALGELLSAILWTAIHRGELPASSPVFALSWHTKYLDPGSALERQMLRNGWCLSEVEKIRSCYQGLGTLHYLSRMRKEPPPQETNQARHAHCSRDSCTAFQIVKGAYRTSHAAHGCACSDLSVDIEAVVNILETTSTFPVLRVDTAPDDAAGATLRMAVEPYENGIPYVAISHVWADGMGNPSANALPRCQIAHIARLVETVGTSVESDAHLAGPCRIWIDTLLCPVNEHSKKTSLNRIADVYRKATCVLVLDSSIRPYRADELTAADVLLRSFACSTWMRRLWTLQEGALAKKVYFQFADQAVNVLDQLKTLRSAALRDPRLVPIFVDITSEVLQVRAWFAAAQPAPSPLFALQKALHFRTVSEPSDEPLCIATLLALDMDHVASAADASERMRRVWALVAAKYGIPPRIVFSSDAGLAMPGWRWAPKSLLAVSFASDDSVMDVHARLSRFAVADVEGASGSPLPLAVPGPRGLGLRVVFPGYRLRPVARVPGRLQPWAGLIKSREDEVLVRLTSTQQWIKLADFYRSKKLETWTDEEQHAYDDKADQPLSRSIRTGHCAVLCSQDVGAAAGMQLCVMAQVEAVEENGSHDDEECSPLRARKERRIIIREANASEALIADTMQELAGHVARHAANDELQKLDKTTADGAAYESALAKVRACMKELTAEAWRTRPGFVQAVHDSIGPDMEEYMWAHIPMYFSYDILAERVPSSQVWFVD